MSFSQREADWLGDVDIEQGVLEVLTEGFPEEHVPEGMARYEMSLNYGQPTVNDWLDRQCQEGMKVSDEKRLAIARIPSSHYTLVGRPLGETSHEIVANFV